MGARHRIEQVGEQHEKQKSSVSNSNDCDDCNDESEQLLSPWWTPERLSWAFKLLTTFNVEGMEMQQGHILQGHSHCV